ncbi:MAG: hypothetical protein EOO23_04930 [Comamonadaceae bacterium]|nr:MAG: hypothetical protein EOO23_04930 [Comamonadaceae bacterium]
MQAATWVDYDESADGATLYLDTSSIKATGKNRSAWSKVVRTTPQVHNGELLQSWVALIEADCIGRTQRTLSEVGYRPDGTTLYQIGEGAVFTPVIPDSAGERRFKLICTHRIGKK